MVKAAVVRHMSSVEDYRTRLASLQGSWDTLSLLSHLRGDGADMSGTRQAFEALANDLIHSLGEETYKKALLGLRAKAQIAIDVMVRNLFERTADIGFLATDDGIRDYLRQRRAKDAPVNKLNERLRGRFREYVGKYSVYHDVVLLDIDGSVLVRLDEQYNVPRTSHELLQHTLTTRQGYVESYGRIDLLPDSERNLVYSFRVGDGARTDGVLCLCFRFEDEVEGIFAKLRAPDDWTLFCFLDRRARVIASSDAWQIPIGAPLPMALDEGGRIVRFAGREYLAITCRTQGYQGYLGPGWFGHAMLPIEHAFNSQTVEGTRSISRQLLAELRESHTIFSASLRKIPVQADGIQRELNRTVWNGNVRLATSADHNSDFTKVLLREIGNAGRRTQETFERSISELQETVVSAILEDAQLLASLAVDVLDRNLYERANDCRWWALNGALSRCLSAAGGDAGEILRHINSLYTVYHDIVLFDSAGRIVAVSNPAHAHKVGETIAAPWIAATLELRDSQQYAVSSFAPSELYEARHTLIYSAAIRDESRRVLGGIGVVFDSAPQFKAMLRDALPRTESGEVVSGSIGLFVDARMTVVAATSDYEPGDTIALPRDLLGAERHPPQTICMNGVHYGIGVRKSSGYREYTGMGVFSLILIPLGQAIEQVAVRRSEPQNHRRGLTQERMIDIATFYCGQQRLGLLRDEIVEALDGAHLRPIPNAPAWHAGLLMYRDTPLPVIDLGRLLNTGQHAAARNVIVVRAAGTQLFGLLVEELADIPEIEVSRILPVGDLNTRGAAILDRAIRPERAEEPALMLMNIQQLLMFAGAAGFKLPPSEG
ncbi:chemotaxis protein CheW [Steroidobacter sp. S1-65]|uniref:Chemotaxis protein CheW n=1 Tax=Steroidobacter gossypii TaxID=2805490 RepID=A0ABS1X634_9GAMM|nr:chemotaxis protein CheW [Steroidobacter gossypii]MBM0108681.1 chemotaxis protein CheW [Steroidobacter gossypii]